MKIKTSAFEEAKMTDLGLLSLLLQLVNDLVLLRQLGLEGRHLGGGVGVLLGVEGLDDALGLLDVLLVPLLHALHLDVLLAEGLLEAGHLLVGLVELQLQLLPTSGDPKVRTKMKNFIINGLFCELQITLFSARNE